MRLLSSAVLLGLGVLGASAAQAEEAASACPQGTICAADPQTVVNAMQEAGYKAKLTASKSSGNPLINSAAAGYNFEVQFFNCTIMTACKSLAFLISFDDDGTNTPELANQWNDVNRFSTMSVSSDKSLVLAYDISTVGGLNSRNFEDLLDTWNSTLGEVSKFFKAHPAPAKPEKGKPKS